MESRLHTFWMAIHRYSGLVMALFLAFAAITGSMLCFMRPLDVALNSDLFLQPAAQAAPPVTLLVDRFQTTHPQWSVQSFPLSVGPDHRIPIKVAPAAGAMVSGVDQIFLDRATGAVAGARNDRPALNRRGAMEWLHDAHYTLLAGDWGRWLMGTIAVLWTVGTVIGVYLTFPTRGAFWKQWKRTWFFSFKTGFIKLMRDLHRSFGLWLLIPLFLLAFTSVAFNFLSEAYSPVIDRLFPEPVTEFPIAKGVPADGGRLSFTKAVERASRAGPKFGDRSHPASVVYDAEDDRIGVTLTDDGTVNYRAFGPIYLYFEAKSGRLANVVNPYRGNTNLTMIRVLYPIHSGRIAGPITVAVVFVCGLVTFGMCVTGVYLWWKKRGGRVAARRAQRRRKLAVVQT
jgi:uncharacterized iron-regulated membrane protein